MKLNKLLEEIDYECINGNADEEITDVVYDSRKISKGCLFICIKGLKFDGHSVCREAAAKGAVAFVTETDVDAPEDVTIIRVEDTRLAMAHIAACWFGYPARQLTTIGITGTKGKTTTTYLIKAMLERAGFKTGLVGTIEIDMGSETIAAVNTTPESFLLQQYFRKMVDNGLDTVVMEVSSQGLMMHRTAGIEFDYGIFTNIEPDHIGPGEHKDYEDYLRCKSILFKQCKVALVNGDDKETDRILMGSACKAYRFGMNEGNDYRALNIELWKDDANLGIEFDVVGAADMHVRAGLPGMFSTYNALTAIAVCNLMGVDSDAITAALPDMKVKGRIEITKLQDGAFIIIDYAHNAMSLQCLLETLRAYEPGRLICLFGCGGNRAKARRYEMGETAGRLADYTIITSDNPRDEDPEAIMDDIVSGMERTAGKYIRIADRREAIAYAIEEAKKGDVIVLAGKGHEDYQEIKGVKYPMDERVIISDILTAKCEK